MPFPCITVVICLLLADISCVLSVDGSWSKWSSWTACSSFCEDGTRSRNRSCINPATFNGGRPCVGPSVVTQHCWSGFCNPTPDDCDFENSQNFHLCGWEANRQWYVTFGHYYKSRPFGDHTKSGAGFYALSQSPYRGGSTSWRLRSKIFPSTPERTIQFFYSNVGRKLRVLLNDSITERELWSTRKDTGQGWVKVEIPYNHPRQYMIIFESSIRFVTTSSPYVALDDVHFVEGGELLHWTGWSAWSPCDFHCKRMRVRMCLDHAQRRHCPNADLSGREIQKEACSSCSVNCDFDEYSNPMCHWTDESQSARFLRRYRLSSPSYPSSGPAKDNSKTGLGYYLLADSSLYTYSYIQARSRQFPKTKGAQISFFYLMYGSHVRELKVVIESGNQSKEIWTQTGSKGRQWIKVVVEYYSSNTYSVVFRAVTGGRRSSDIAIDDISFADVKTGSVGWSIWSVWSLFHRNQFIYTRDRYCMDHVDHISMCPGVNPATNMQVQFRHCRDEWITHCAAIIYGWSNWTEWTSCNEYGFQRRERYCLNQGNTSCIGANLHGAQEEQRVCSNELFTGDCNFENSKRPFCNWKNVPGKIPFMIHSGSTASQGTSAMEPERDGHRWTNGCNENDTPGRGRSEARGTRNMRHEKTDDDDDNYTRQRSSTEEVHWKEINRTSSHTGKYLYMDSSYWLYGSVARLRSKLLSPADHAEFVFSFYMYGKTVNFLKLFILINDYKIPLFEVAGDQGKRWHTEHVLFRSLYPYRLMFEAAAGLDYRSDIALDDFRLHLHDVDGGWSEWGSWSNCTFKCVQTRERTCTEPRRQNRGMDCVGARTESRYCSDGKCSLSPSAPVPSLSPAPVCGGKISGASGVILSPNFPSAYRNNFICAWRITALTAHVISLNLTSLSLEACCDYVTLRNGGSNGPIIARINGVTGLNQVYTSTGRVMFVSFTTDGSVVRSGFRAFWRSIIQPSIIPVPSTPVPSPSLVPVGSSTLVPSPTPLSDDSHGNIKRQKILKFCSGRVCSNSSPNFPSLYSNVLLCTWISVLFVIMIL